MASFTTSLRTLLTGFPSASLTAINHVDWSRFDQGLLMMGYANTFSASIRWKIIDFNPDLPDTASISELCKQPGISNPSYCRVKKRDMNRPCFHAAVLLSISIHIGLLVSACGLAFRFLGRRNPEAAVQAPVVIPIKRDEREFLDVYKNVRRTSHERRGLRHGLILAAPYDGLRGRVAALP